MYQTPGRTPENRPVEGCAGSDSKKDLRIKETYIQTKILGIKFQTWLAPPKLPRQGHRRVARDSSGRAKTLG